MTNVGWVRKCDVLLRKAEHFLFYPENSQGTFLQAMCNAAYVTQAMCNAAKETEKKKRGKKK